MSKVYKIVGLLAVLLGLGALAFFAEAGAVKCGTDVECIENTLEREHITVQPVGYVGYYSTECKYSILRKYGDESFFLAKLTKGHLRGGSELYQYGVRADFDGKMTVKVNGETTKVDVLYSKETVTEATSAYLEECA